MFEEYFKTFDDECREKNRYIQVWVDNCAAHPKSVNNILTNIELCYLPPNVTSVAQPCDQGIIKVVKGHFRNGLVKFKIKAAKNNSESEEISLLDSIKMLARIWNTKLSKQTISNCFKKAGFVHKDQNNNDVGNNDVEDTVDTENTEDDFECNNYFKDLNDGFSNLQYFLSFDDHLSTNNNLSDDNIIELVTLDDDTNDTITNESNDNKDEKSFTDLEHCFTRIETKLTQCEGVTTDILSSFYNYILLFLF